MKLTHRDDVLCWSRFDDERDLDFHSYLWQRPDGNVVIDPLPMSAHDQEQVQALGGIAAIVITNSDHVRDTVALKERTGAEVLGPSAEAAAFPIDVDRWLVDGDQPLPGLRVLEMTGSKTPGELALILEDHTLIPGDLVRCHRGGRLTLLPAAKLRDAAAARASVERLMQHPIEAVLCTDGWPLFAGGHDALAAALGT